MRRSAVSYAATDHATRALTLPLLLDTIRRDPGMTAAYYANRYFGKERQMEVTRVLWAELKLYGQVTIDRIDGPEAPPRWYPVFSMPRRIHKIRRHCAEEEDLSVLQQCTVADTGEPPLTQEAAASMATSVESSIIALVQQFPGHDIQFYIGELSAVMQPHAPMAFRRLREAGVLIREQTPQGTFAWR
ncbi:uncharacterized protein Tco025E_07212 [Trypanosoma conorhini]|uniref:Uncharacterized protein n=1 Tax=Trypanosoma conorhini TaxID=83891 RepID=A0A422NRR8_9TRYP|nr:uncharacterized protein Tco025E_07212 [Trypanosoma conorhini]RNF08170.1 hypothetical protein Tco025E_07212 [Trypanosoma conorhini]